MGILVEAQNLTFSRFFPFQVQGTVPAAAVLWPNGAWSQIPRWHHVPRHPTKCLGHRDASANTFEGEAESWNENLLIFLEGKVESKNEHSP